MTNQIKVLEHDELVYVDKPGWGKFEAASIFSIEGYARKIKQDPREMLERERSRGHDIVSTSKSGHCIHSDPERYKIEEAKKDKAILIKEGETVSIENRLYKVKLMGVRYSDPIHFTRIDS